MSSERKFEAEVLDELWYQRGLLQRIIRHLDHEGGTRLTRIRIAFIAPQPKAEEETMPPVPGPITLTTAGQTDTAVLLGFDQFGNPMPADFKMPAASFSIDDKAGAVVKAVDNGDGTATVTAVATGTATLSVSATSAEGKDLSDSTTITVSIGPPPAPVLSSIKIAFTG